jgi:SAM-dependent methyltransferase
MISNAPKTNGSASSTSAAVICPMCKSDDQTLLFHSNNGYPIVRCTNCALVFADDRGSPPPAELYPAFDQSKTPGLERLRYALGVFLRQREAFVRRVTPRSVGAMPRLLDFGCGAGAFATWMSRRGYDVVGLEPYSLSERSDETEHLHFVHSPIENAGDALGQFDVITMWHVLEHLHNPVETLKAIVPHLAPDGVLVISVPNFESWQSRVFEGGWFHLDPPRHLLQFEESTLTDCVSRAGLVASEKRRFLPEYGSSGWLQSALNKVLPHDNYLYELVKDRGALRGMSTASSALHLGASVAAAPPILAVGMVIEAIASVSNHGAALTIAARRSKSR